MTTNYQSSSSILVEPGSPLTAKNLPFISGETEEILAIMFLMLSGGVKGACSDQEFCGSPRSRIRSRV